jgi:AcrR family transcriptional regulator
MVAPVLRIHVDAFLRIHCSRVVATRGIATLHGVTTADPAPRRAYRKADQVKSDLVDATIDLLSERLPSQVTVREIAERAGVQHSMITRHFGSKAALVAEAVGSVASGYAAAVAAADGPDAGFVAGLQHLRSSPASGLVLAAPAAARAGEDEAERFPGVAAHLRQLLESGEPDDERTRLLAGMSISLVIAWSAMRATALDAVGLDRIPPEEVDRMAEELLAAMVASQMRA